MLWTQRPRYQYRVGWQRRSHRPDQKPELSPPDPACPFLYTDRLEMIMKTVKTVINQSFANKSITHQDVKANQNQAVVYRARDNDDKTTDGISQEETRFANEIQERFEWDYEVSNSTSHNHHVSISFVGSLLWGLYALLCWSSFDGGDWLYREVVGVELCVFDNECVGFGDDLKLSISGRRLCKLWGRNIHRKLWF